MATYKIEATIEKLKQDEGTLEIQLKGVGKYLFEKEKDKEYCNILEEIQSTNSPTNATLTILPLHKDQKIHVCTNNLALQQTLSYAFLEKKKLKFELERNIATIPINTLPITIIAISHASN